MPMGSKDLGEGIGDSVGSGDSRGGAIPEG